MKILIVKTAALGDVLRNTVILSELDGEIYWLTKRNALDLLNSKKIAKKIVIEDKEEVEKLKSINFDLIISLEESKDLLNIVKEIKTKKLIGIYLGKDDKITYSKEGSDWFEMSLISKYGMKRANELKIANKRTYNEIYMEMIGKKFFGQEYDIGYNPKKVKGVIGIIDKCGDVWPNKGWFWYDQLKEMLKKDRYEVRILGMRPTIKEHIEDINNCELIVCGDTLGMHIALALKKKVVALFNCTPADEIYDYGRMTKLVSPLYEKWFFSREYSEEVIKSIPLEEAYNAVKSMMEAQ